MSAWYDRIKWHPMRLNSDAARECIASMAAEPSDSFGTTQETRDAVLRDLDYIEEQLPRLRRWAEGKR